MLDELFKKIDDYSFAHHKVPYENFSKWLIYKLPYRIEVYLDEIKDHDFRFFKKITRNPHIEFNILIGVINNDESCIKIVLRYQE